MPIWQLIMASKKTFKSNSDFVGPVQGPTLPVDSCGLGGVSAFRRLFSIRLTSDF